MDSQLEQQIPPQPPQPPEAQTPDPTADAGKKKPTGLIIGIVSAVVAIGVVVALIVSGVFSKGNNSPEAAARSMFEAISADGSLKKLASTVSPADAETFMEGVARGTEGAVDSDPTSYAKETDDLLKALDITHSDLVFEEVPLADDVTRVQVKSGTLTVAGEADQVTSALDNLLDAAAADNDEISPQDLASLKEELAENVEMLFSEPVEDRTLDFADAFSDEFDGLEYFSVVATNEKGGWYVSPLMTISDWVYQEGGFSEAPLGDQVVPAGKFSTPEEATESFMTGLLEGNLDAVAGTLPLAERRLVSVYGPALLGDEGSSTEALWGEDEPTMVSQAYSAAVDGSWALVAIDDLTVDDGYSTLSVSGECLSADGEEVCLSDMDDLPDLHLDEGVLASVKEDGSWFVTVSGTFGYWLGVLSTNEDFINAISEDALSDLVTDPSPVLTDEDDPFAVDGDPSTGDGGFVDHLEDMNEILAEIDALLDLCLEGDEEACTAVDELIDSLD